MFNTFERMVAFRYLRPGRKGAFVSVIAWFSFLGIMLGVATLIVVMAVMNGFRAELTGRILGINSHISVISRDGLEEYDALASKLSEIPGVKYAVPTIQGQVLASANGKHIGAVVRGIQAEDLQKKTLVAENIMLGTLADMKGNGVIIGSRMARNMRLVPGDTLRLISPKTTQTFLGAMPRLKDYTVVGTFEVGMFEYDNGTIFMPLPAAQTYFKMPGKTTAVEMDIEDVDQLTEVKRAIMQATEGKYYLIDWQESNRQFLNSLQVERNVMFLILTLIIMIAAFNIVGGMIMLVKSKTKEIGILRTMGATRGAIMRIFFMTGAMIGVGGTLFGFLLGIGFASNIETIRQWLEALTDTELFAAEIYFLSQLPADIQAGQVIQVVVMALVLSLLAPMLPAWQAARLNPVEGLRHE